MLVSLILLATMLLSWLSSGSEQAAGPIAKPPVAPQNPSTLTLALIGAVTLGVYFAVSRRTWRRRAGGNSTGRLSDQRAETAAAPGESEEHLPSRGAA